MINQVDPTMFRRLVLAKRLYLHGCVHAANKDDISKMIAIHNFDNSIEFILKCLATKYGVYDRIKRLELYFHDLWNEINNEIKCKCKSKLPYRKIMKDLHNLRNTVQHQGDIPSFNSVIKYLGYSEEFFKKVVEDHFEVSYDQLTLTTLIDNSELRDRVSLAEIALNSKRYDECINHCMNALYISFRISNILDHAKKLGTFWGLGPEFKNLTDKKSTYIEEKYSNTPFYEFAIVVSKALRQVGQSTMAMQYLDEYKVDFIKFFAIKKEIDENLENLSEPELKERAQFALEFVLNFLLNWQEIGLLK